MHPSYAFVLFGIVFTCASTLFAQEAPERVIIAQKETVPTSLQGTWTFVDVKSDQTDQSIKEALKNHRMQELRVTGDRFKWIDARSNVTDGEIIRIKRLGEDSRWEVDFSVEWKGDSHVRYGILEVQDDRLRLCFNAVEPSDDARRPQDSKLATPNRGTVLLEYDRKK